jgi:putative tryptophan/tyrosine transport system substrate-binding protein
MRRRDFIKVIAGSATVWPLAARAQQPAMPVVGFINGGSPEGYAPMVAAFRSGLNERGYIEGDNVLVEYRWAEGHYDRLPSLATDLVGRQVAVIAANTPATPVAKAATTTIPIVFVTASDPIASGFVTSLNRPGGNLTGVALLNVEIGSKRLELKAKQEICTPQRRASVCNYTCLMRAMKATLIRLLQPWPKFEQAHSSLAPTGSSSIKASSWPH